MVQAPKSRLDARQTEDAARIVLPAPGVAGEARLVVADGSSGSAESGWWATRLADDLCAAPGRAFHSAKAFHTVASGAALRWPSRRQALSERFAAPGQKSWIALRRLDSGPATTILGIRLLPAATQDDDPAAVPGGGQWQVVAVGDACMFQVRTDRVVDAVAVQPRRPPVVRADPRPAAPKPAFREGHWHDRDVFYVMTDALGRWWRRNAEEGGLPWTVLDTVCGSNERFTAWVQAERTRRMLQDDDITLLRAECGPC
ncbi:hypothetical protein [Streptomyces mangrovisoli]|nr:hypothetical protein [Streptomyces mangrovisoli]